MSRITMCLEGNTEGKVLASFDLDEFASKVRADAIDELVDAVCCHSAFTNMQKDAIKIYAEQLKEQK